MKFINKLLLIALIVAFGACDNTDLDLQVDPNAVTPEAASVNDLYNNIQLTFENVINQSFYQPGQAARMYHYGGNFTYEAITSPNSFNFLWFQVYSTLFPDIDALLSLAEERGLAIHAGSAKIIKAYTLMAMVDLFGSVPLSQAGQGTEVISPAADSGDQIYATAVAMLDEAIAQMSGTTAPAPASDLFYGGDAAKWVTAANTLKLRAAMTTRLTDPSGAASMINSVIAGGDYIDTEAEDFQFNFGNKRNNPNSRHRFYNNHYEIGDGDYLSNYFMWLLRADKFEVDANGNEVILIDPRIRFYFYRKKDDSVNQDQTTYSCHFSLLPDQAAQPDHYEKIDPRLPYCVAWEDGYSGRDHLNGEGIPPDGPIRTSYGLYPGGGQFDDDTFSDTRQAGTTGGLGQGIWPVMLSSYVNFLRAEAALTVNTGEDARALLESGIRSSIDKVVGFKSLVPSTMSRTVEIRGGGTGTVEELFVPVAEDIDAYVNFVLAQYDAGDADKKLDVVMKEYLIALWGNGLEAYNMWRRTGKPNNMAPGLEPATGDFPRTFFLPAVHVNRNANAAQKTLTERVFWDDGSVDLY